MNLLPVPLRPGMPEQTREGDSYVARWPRAGYGVVVADVSESREGPEGEVRVFGEARPGERVLVHQCRLRLLGSNAKRDLAKLLQEQTKGVGADGGGVDWRAYLEVACHGALEQYRAGEPIVDLADVPIEPQRYVVEGLVPTGRTTLLIGDGGMSTKSLQALAMGLAVATGRPVGPYKPGLSGPVLYADGETDPVEVADRLHRLSLGLGLAGVPRGLLYQPQLRALVQSRRGLRDALERTGAVLLIVDSAGAVANGSLNDDQVAIGITNALRSLGSVVARLVIHHVSKATAAQENGRGRTYGNVYFENYSRSVIELRRDGDSPTEFSVGVFHRKVNRGPLFPPFAVRVRFEDPGGPIRLGRDRIEDHTALAAFSGSASKILAALVEEGAALQLDDLARRTGLDESTVRKAAASMPGVVRIDGGPGRGNKSLYALRSDRDPAEASG